MSDLPDIQQVARLRADLWSAGYRPLALYTRDKRPFDDAWQDRARLTSTPWCVRWASCSNTPCQWRAAPSARRRCRNLSGTPDGSRGGSSANPLCR